MFKKCSGILTAAAVVAISIAYPTYAESLRIQKPLNLTGEVSTLAGTAWIETSGTDQMTPHYDDGPGLTKATFSAVRGITTDGTNLYVTDHDNGPIGRIRRIVIATGEVTTLPGSGEGITTDGKNLYIADNDNHRILKIVIATGEVTTLAGGQGNPESEKMPFGFADGHGSTARFYGPTGITTDGTTLYVTDAGNYCIRKVVIATGDVSTLAGSRKPGFADGSPATAKFNILRGVTNDGTNLYVVDSSNQRIRKVAIATGYVSTIAGSGKQGFADGSPKTAQFSGPDGITTDGTNLYVTDTFNHLIRKIVLATGVVSTVAGIVGTMEDADGFLIGDFADGAGNKAKFSFPHGIITDGKNLYVADTGNYRIRKIK